MRTLVGTLFIAGVLLASCGPEPPSTGPEAPGNRLATTDVTKRSGLDVTDRYIVVFKDHVGDPAHEADELARLHGGTVHFRYTHALRGFAATIPEAALHGIRHNPNVLFVEPDGIATTMEVQTSPPSWGLDRVDQRNLPMDNVYSYLNGGTDVTVYIIDSGIRSDHQEYSGRVVAGPDYIDNDNNPADCRGHGTHVAGTVGGLTVGVAKNVTLVAVRVLNCSGQGTLSQIIAGVDWVTRTLTGPSVANMSLGGAYSASVNLAVANSITSGVVYALAAGNSNADACATSPASTPTAITVGATTASDARASFSNYGSCVDVFAPGVDINSSTMSGTNTYGRMSGTSMASPHVAGVAALYLCANPAATPAQVATAIINNATTNVLSWIGTGSPNRLLHNFSSATPSEAPPAPSGLVATAASGTSIDLTWSDNSSDETGFTIERGPTSAGPFSWVADVSASVTSYTNTGLDEGATYWYRVRANKPGISSAWSSPAGAVTPIIIHVAGLSSSSSTVRGGWTGTLTITVRSESGALRSGVTVAVSWSGGSASAVTGPSGQCSVTTGKLRSSVADVTMSVTNLSGTGFTYDSDANSPDPPSLTIGKP